MYIPNYFREERLDVLAATIHKIQIAAMVTSTDHGLQVTHLPMLLNRPDGSDDPTEWKLEAHVARGNPHWTFADAETVAVFAGPQAYISPTGYISKSVHGKVVPTWTYVAVHVHGTFVAVDDPEWLLTHVNALTDQNEATRTSPWSVADAPVEYIDKLTKAIVGIELTVSRIEGSWKMNQQKTTEDRDSVIGALLHETEGKDVAEIMRAIQRREEEAK